MKQFDKYLLMGLGIIGLSILGRFGYNKFSGPIINEFYKYELNKKIDTPKGNKKAYLMIDMQDGYLNSLYEEERKLVVENNKLILEYCKVNDLPVIITEMKEVYDENDTFGGLRKELDSVNDVTFIKKKYQNAFWLTDIEDILFEKGIGTVITGGGHAYGCVTETASGLLDYGFKLITNPELLYGNYFEEGMFKDQFIQRFDTIVLPFQQKLEEIIK